jgi:hypothetical protein
VDGAAAVPCSPVFVEPAAGVCASPADGFCGARFVFAFGGGVVWARAPDAKRLIAAARQSERSMPVGSGANSTERARE